MSIRVRYFASIREALGAGETLAWEEPLTLAQLRDRLAAASEAHAAVLGRQRVLRMALDQLLSDEAATVGDGAEVAFFPPVTGG